MQLRPDLFAGVLPFVRTADERSFGRAAASLGITTAAVSKAVRRLEEDLGVKLLDRSSRSVTLTREGELFLERSRRAVSDVQNAREVVQGQRREPQGELAITIPVILATFLVPALARLSSQYPRLTFRVHMTDRLTRLADERYDIAIRMGELEPSSLVTRVLRAPQWATVAAPSYLARKPPPQTVDDLARHDCLRFVAPNGRPREWTFLVDRTPRMFEVDGNLLIDNGSHLVTAAEAGMGICQVLDFMVVPALREGRLVGILADHAAPGPAIHAVMTPSRARSANVRAFMQVIVDVFSR